MIRIYVKYGSTVRGAFYDDRASLRVQDTAKIKANKLVMVKMRFEFTAIRPGVITSDGRDSSIKLDEDRIKLLKVVTLERVKGNDTLGKLI